uniref:Ovule protein n=1 Tax=Strongyloides papillosus TaxID=174720 RepID=A0A0N5CAQ2_STREA
MDSLLKKSCYKVNGRRCTQKAHKNTGVCLQFLLFWCFIPAVSLDLYAVVVAQYLLCHWFCCSDGPLYIFWVLKYVMTEKFVLDCSSFAMILKHSVIRKLRSKYTFGLPHFYGFYL